MARIRVSLDPGVRRVAGRAAEALSAAGIEAYAVGGFLRDVLLRRPVRDVDLLVRGDALAAAAVVGRALGARVAPLRLEHGIVRVAKRGAGPAVDITGFSGALEEDLRRRDYTVNAMAAPLGALVAGEIVPIDPLGGLGDLAARRLRAVSEAAFLGDPLRLLRGVRLAAELGFEIERETFALMRRHAALVAGAAVERQRDELLLILASGAAGAAMRRLDDLGLLSPVLPELDAARGFEQPKEHYWDVFNHLLEAVARMDLLLAPAPPPSPEERWIWEELWEALAWWEDGRRRLEAPVAGAASRAAVLKLAALLHDIGKPATRTYEADGRMRFFGHSAVGARMARRLLRRMRFPRRVIETVCTIIEAHLRPLQMAHYGLPTPRAVYRYFRDTGEAGVDTLFVSLADHLATVGPRISRAAWRRHVAVVNHILRSRYAAPAAAAPSRLVDGHVLMAELGLAPGPLVGELLEAVREAHAAGEVHTRDEAVSLARRRLSEIRAGR